MTREIPPDGTVAGTFQRMPEQKIKMHNSYFSSTAALLVFCVLGGCTVLDPYGQLSESMTVKGKALVVARVAVSGPNASFHEAENYLHLLRESYYGAISEHGTFGRVVGVSLIGGAAGALALGATTAQSGDTITRIGVGGAALYMLDDWLKLPPKMRAYQAGIVALNCAQSTFASIGAMDPVTHQAIKDAVASLAFDTEALDQQIVLVQQQLAIARDATALPDALRPDKEKEVARAVEILASGRAARSEGRRILAMDARSTARMRDATEAIRAAVTAALMSAEGDPAQLLASLAKAIPANAALVTGSSPITPQAGSSKLLKDPDINRMKSLAEGVNIQTLKLMALLDSSGVEPSKDELEQCALIDAQAAGITFDVAPTGLQVDRNVSNKATLSITGGKPPYAAKWTGQTPPGTDAPSVKHETGGSTRAEASISIAETTPAGTYTLIVDDSGQGHRTVLVSVVGSSPAAVTKDKDKDKAAGGSGEGTTAKVSNPAVPDKTLLAVQTLLVELGCMPKDLPNGKTSQDGLSGPTTDAGLKKYWDKPPGIKASQRDMTSTLELLNDEKANLDQAKAANTSTTGIGCR